MGLHCPSPCVGDPVNAGMGNKTEARTEYSGSGIFPLRFAWTYNSLGGSSSILGRNRTHSYSWQLTFFLTGATIPIISVQQPDGTSVRFTQPQVNGSWVVDPDQEGKLTAISGSGSAAWQFDDGKGGREWFNANGLLIALFNSSGFMQSVGYDSSGRIASVTDPNGRVMTFEYNANNLLWILHTPDAGQISFSYSSANDLTQTTYPDSTFVQYRYDESAYSSSSLTGLLTGVIDENSVRYSTTTYNANGRGTNTVLGTGVESHTIGYLAPGVSGDYSQSTVSLPLGATQNTEYVLIAGVVRPRVVTTSCSGCEDQVTSYVYNDDGRVLTKVEGSHQTNYTYGDTRGLETQRVEAVGTSEQRTTNTVWNPNFRVPDQRSVVNANGVTESLTNWAYNTRGQVSARCEVDPAVSGAAGYVCGSSTSAPTGVRQWTYTYCEQSAVTAGTCPLVGLLLSTDGPRTDVSDVTTYAYYQTTDVSGCSTLGGSCHYLGDLYSVTNALGQTTTYVGYDKNGRVTRMQDANGVYTDMTYHPRGWLLTRTVRANADGTPDAALDATTTFGYDNVGNVTSIVQPDTTAMEYVYDAAHRLTDIYDSPSITNTANSDHIHYTLDAAGNRTNESTYDPANTLRRSLSRTIDQLNHVTGMLNASNVALQSYRNPAEAPPSGITYNDGYDGNGNAVYSVDANGVGTEQQYDPLNRLKTTLQDHAGTGSTKDTTTQYAYDARDNLRSVTDPDKLVTNYTYDGLDNLTQLSSPDTGITNYPNYDAAGNRLTQTDANGITVNYSYDALNRLTGITYPTTSLDITYAYDVPATGCYNVGRLTKITDSSGSTTYCYDLRGNVLTKTQVTGGTTLTTGYTYTLADRLQSITYPSGAIVNYGRDGTGRITSVTYQANATATAQTIVSSASYYPFGPLNTLTFGNGRTLTKTYDQNYAIGTVASSDPNGLAISAGVDPLGNLTHASNGANPPSQAYSYDALYRLTGVTDSSNSTVEAYTYGLTGDRLSKTVPPQAAQTYAYATGTHHLVTAGSDARTFDANGNTTSSSAAATVFTYDDRNRLSAVGYSDKKDKKTQYLYLYNGRGERVGKQNAKNGKVKGATDYVYNESGQLLGEYPGTRGVQTADYIYLDSTPVAYITSGTVYYIETDQLGTPRDVVKPGAPDTVVWKWDYFSSAFGENAPNQDPSNTGTAFTFNLRFPGQYYDAETGLNYNYFRDYEPGTGRYVESDPIGLRGGANTYDYVRSMPLRAFDPKGTEAWQGCPDGSVAPVGGCASNPPSPPPESPCGCGGDIASAAASHAGEGGWGQWGFRGGPLWFGDPKCNLFVYRVIAESGSAPPIVNGRGATAPEMGDPSQPIPNWPVDSGPHSGDIIAGEHHAGIVVPLPGGGSGTASANFNTGTITINDWGFRGGQHPTYRHYQPPNSCGCGQ